MSGKLRAGYVDLPRDLRPIGAAKPLIERDFLEPAVRFALGKGGESRAQHQRNRNQRLHTPVSSTTPLGRTAGKGNSRNKDIPIRD